MPGRAHGSKAPPLARGTLWMLGWQGARAVLQATWAIGLARLLGPADYGLLAGTAGMATALGALAGLGFGLLMLQAASRSPDAFARHWHNALVAILASGVLLLAGFLLAAPHVTGHPVEATSLLAIGLPELMLLPLTISASYAFQAHERMGWAGAMYTLGPAGNVVALAGFWLLADAHELADYLRWHAWTSAAAAMLALALVQWRLRPAWRRPLIGRADLREAGGFTGMRVVDTALGSLDKTLVLRLAGDGIAGQYTAAFRLASLVALPMVSLAISATPRLFRGAAGERDALARTLLRWGLLAGVASVPLTWGLATLLPLLFGDEFAAATSLARWFAPLPALLGLASLGCAILMAVGRRRTRVALQAGALATLLVSMTLLAAHADGLGATAALLLTQALLVLALWRSILATRPASGPSSP